MSIEYDAKNKKCELCNERMQFRVVDETITRGTRFDSKTIIDVTQEGMYMKSELNTCFVKKLTEKEWQMYLVDEHYRLARIAYDDNIIEVCPKCTYAEVRYKPKPSISRGI